MKKFYRLTAFIFIMIAIFFSGIIVIFQKDVREFLSAYNKIDGQTELLVDRPQMGNGDASQAALDLSLLSNPKFLKLQKNEVDMTGVVIPPNLQASTTGSTTASSTKPTEVVPDFKVGNNNPFKSR